MDDIIKPEERILWNTWFDVPSGRLFFYLTSISSSIKKRETMMRAKMSFSSFMVH